MWKRIACIATVVLAAASACPQDGKGTTEGEPEITCNTTLSGELRSNAPRIDRVAAEQNTISLSCNLPAEDSAFDQCEYALIPFHSSTGGPFQLKMDPFATTIPDTVLYLYCSPFDPAQPEKNLISFNDDFNGSLLSGFGPGLELTLVPDYTYWLVLSTFNALSNPEEGEGEAPAFLGAYTICLSDGYVFGEYTPGEGEDAEPLACPLNSGFTQDADTSFTATALPSNNLAGRQIFELITGVDDPITAIRWWGVTGNQINTPCDPAQLTYRVGFYEKSGLIPIGNINEFTAAPTISDTGLTLFGMPIHRYDLTLPEPVTLPNNEGFASVYVANSVDGCRFSWHSSTIGDDASLYFNFSALSYQSNSDDVALCLATEPDCPGETPLTAGSFRVQLIDPALSTVVGNATVTLNRLPNFSYPTEYDPIGGLFRVDCLPFGAYTAVVDAPGYAPYSAELNYQQDGTFETFFLQTAEGEGEGEGGGCKGCGFLTTVFVSVLNMNTEKGLTNARVRLVGTLLDITENVSGVYVLPTLSDGTYTLRVEAEGFVSEEEIFSVANDTVLGITVRLKPVQGAPVYDHTADADTNGRLDLGELLGIIQLFNFGRYHCEGEAFLPGPGNTSCTAHSCDYQPAQPDFIISLSELLRGIQIYTQQAYYACEEGEDGYCLGTP